MTPRKKPVVDEERDRFESGRTHQWSAGGYGWTVKLFAKAGKLKISWQEPQSKKTKQRTLFSTDSRELRERATRYAVTHAEKLRAGEGAEETKKKLTFETLTVFDVVLLYMQRVPGFNAELLEKTQAGVQEWYRTLPEKVRELDSTQSEGTVCKDVRSFQHLFKASYVEGDKTIQPFARTRLVSEIEPGDSSRLMGYEIAHGRSPRTVANEHDRLSAAFRHVMSQYRKSIGLLYNPIDGRRADRTPANIDPYSPDEIARLTAKAKEWIRDGRQWQAFVAIGLAGSGRRRGSIQGLTAADHDLEANTVVWQKKFAKGKGYRRGDEMRPMSAMHRAALLWALTHRPNPLGPEHPLLWSDDDPSKAADERQLDYLWRKLEKEAGVPHLQQRAIHSMRRAVVTLLADSIGDGKASEFVGMTVETVRKFSYKHVQSQTMEEAARSLDKSLPVHEEKPPEGEE